MRSLARLLGESRAPTQNSDCPARCCPPAEPYEPAMTQPEVLEAPERGEIDVDEASCRSQEAETDA